MDSDLQGYLDWGSSVNVNEDLTRAIKQEIQDLNQDLRNLSHSIQTEEKTAAQVQRDYSHSLSELTLFVRSAADEKDNAAMNEQIQMKLGESLQNEIVAVISQKADNTSLTGNKENVSPEDGMTEYIIKRARDVKKLTAIIHSSQERIGACQVRLEEAEFELRNANDSFNREQRNHKRWKNEVEDARKEHAIEERRVKGIRDSLARRRKNAAEYTNQTTACMKEYDSVKEEHVAEEDTFKIKLEEMTKRLSNKKAEVEAASNSKSMIEKQVNDLNTQFQKIEDIRKERDSIRNASEQITNLLQTERQSLDELRQKVQYQKERHENNLKAMEELKKEKVEVDEMCLQGQKEEQDLVAMKEDLSRIQAEDENALRAIHELQQRTDTHKKSGSADITEKKQAIEYVEKEIVEKLSEKEQLKDAVNKMKETIADLNASTAQEIALHENLKNSFEDATIVHEKELAKVMEEAARAEANIEKTKLELIAEKITLEKLERGAAIIEDTNKREKEFETGDPVAS